MRNKNQGISKSRIRSLVWSSDEGRDGTQLQVKIPPVFREQTGERGRISVPVTEDSKKARYYFNWMIQAVLEYSIPMYFR